MRLQFTLVLIATVAAAVMLGLAVREDWRVVEMVAGLAMLVLVAVLAFAIFLLSLLRETWVESRRSTGAHHGRSLW